MVTPVIAQRQLAYVVLGHLAAYPVAVAVDAHWRDFLVPVLLLSEQALLIIWAGVGTGRWVPRLVIVYCLCVFCLSLPAVLRAVPATRFLPVHCAAVGALLLSNVVPLAVARSRGFRLRRISQDSLVDAKPFQFTVRAMLLITAGVACLLALRSNIHSEIALRQGNRPIGTLGISMAFLLFGIPALLTWAALLSVWASLSAGKLTSRALVGTVAAAAGGAFLPYCLKGGAHSYAHWSGLTVSLFLVISVSLLAFRAAGYRFVWTNSLDDDLLAQNNVPSEAEGG